jgi:amino acid transporter
MSSAPPKGGFELLVDDAASPAATSSPRGHSQSSGSGSSASVSGGGGGGSNIGGHGRVGGDGGFVPLASLDGGGLRESDVVLDDDYDEDVGVESAGGGGATVAHLSLWQGVSLIVGLVIGSGVFSSPGVVAGESGSIATSMFVWIFAGVLALFGALSYAELGTTMPRSGGEFVYLGAALGPLPAFLFAWAQALVLKPGSQAIIAVVFARYLGSLIYNADPADPSLDAQWRIKAIGFALLAAVSGINAVSVRGAAKFQTVSTVLKLVAVVGIWLLGIVALTSPARRAAGSFPRGLFADASWHPVDLGNACIAALWSYDGWNNLSFVISELRDPVRNLPRAIKISLPIVIIAYAALNGAFFAILDYETVVNSQVIAVAAGETMAARPGAVLVTLAVAISAAGACNGSVRVVMLFFFCSRSPALFSPSSSLSKTHFFHIFGGLLPPRCFRAPVWCAPPRTKASLCSRASLRRGPAARARQSTRCCSSL